MKIQLELVNQVRWNVGLGKSRDVVHCLGRVEWHQCVHLDFVMCDPQCVRNALRKIREDLTCGVLSADNEGEIEAVVEAHLDESRVCWCLRHATRRLDESRHVGGQAGGRTRGGAVDRHVTTRLSNGGTWSSRWRIDE